jgi:hypothetical protein
MPIINRSCSLAGAVALVAAIGSGITSARDPMVVKLDDFAEIELPRGVVLQKSPEQMPDFSVYYLRTANENLLGIYLGNAPDTDQKKLTSTSKFGSCVGRVSDQETSSGRNLDALLSVRGADFPMFVHFFARGLSDQQVADVHHIWQTFRLLGGRSCS